MKLQRTLFAICLAGSLATAGSLFAAEQQPAAPPPAAETKAAMLTMDEARVLALEKVPGGEVSWEGLARSGGQLFYSFELQVPGKKGFEVVSIGAVDRQVVVKHKTAWAQRRDAAQRRRSDKD